MTTPAADLRRAAIKNAIVQAMRYDHRAELAAHDAAVAAASTSKEADRENADAMIEDANQ